MHAILDFALSLALQVDPNLGTKEAQQGAVQRMTEPNYYDLVFPFVAFALVIVLPAVAAAWVIFKTVTDKSKEADET